MESRTSKPKTIFFTGATSGFGMLLAAELANDGASLICTSRNPSRGQQLLEYYRQKYPEGKGFIEILDCDLASFDSVSAACRQVRTRHDRIDVLVNNAGVWNFRFRETSDGIEETLQVNLLSALLITHLLSDLLVASADAKVIFTASGLHQGTINFSDIEFRTRYSGFRCYRQSKLGVILIARLLAKSMENQGGVYSQHPGMIRTKLDRDAGWLTRKIFRIIAKAPVEGTGTLRYLIETPGKNLRSGEYYARQGVERISPESYDLDMAARLLEVSRSYLQPWIDHHSLIFPMR